MKGTILLNYDENTRKVEDEEKSRFLRGILEEMGVPIEEIWDSDEPLNIEQRMKLRKLLTSYGINVIDNYEKMIILVNGENVAIWNKPFYKLKKDMSQNTAEKQLYLEMNLECWSLFEQEENTKQ